MRGIDQKTKPAIRVVTSLFALFAVSMLLSCGGGVTESDTPPPSSGVPDSTGTTPPTGGVQRASITVRVSFSSEDAGLASSAAVTTSGIKVRLQRSSEAPREAETSSLGVALFEGLLEGMYTVSVERVLTELERSRLPLGSDATVFAGGNQITLSPPNSRTVDVSLVASRRGSLVVSEIFYYTNSTNPVYNLGKYIEVFNNSDTTIYLDGVILFSTSSFMHSESIPCGQTHSFRDDDTRLWISSVHTFPGSGRNYPIRAGEGKVIATDALNHITASGLPHFVDLSNAHFEFVGNESDPDNPESANMVRGFGASVGALGKGELMRGTYAYGLALPQGADFLAIDSARSPATGQGAFPDGRYHIFASIRREYVLDVFSTDLTPERVAFLQSINNYEPRCNPWLSHTFERSPAPLFYDFEPRAVRRKAIGTTASGNPILQRTRTSSRDLEYGPPLKRSLER